MDYIIGVLKSIIVSTIFIFVWQIHAHTFGYDIPNWAVFVIAVLIGVAFSKNSVK